MVGSITGSLLGGENFPKGCLFVCFVLSVYQDFHFIFLCWLQDVVRSHTELGKDWLERQSKVNRLWSCNIQTYLCH